MTTSRQSSFLILALLAWSCVAGGCAVECCRIESGEGLQHVGPSTGLLERLRARCRGGGMETTAGDSVDGTCTACQSGDCANDGSACQTESSCRSGCAEDASRGTTSLPEIDFANASPIPVPVEPAFVGRPISGQPIIEEILGETDSIRVRPLNLEQCRTLAHDNSALGNALASEGKLLQNPQCGSTSPPCCVVRILELQAQHERSKSAAQALEAYWQLVEVYLQHDLLLQSTAEIDSAMTVLEKLTEAGVAIDVDPRQLERQQMELEEKAVKLLRGQQRLHVVLALLLNLDRRESIPLWTELQPPDFATLDLMATLPDTSHGASPEASLDVASAIETGLANRQDLAALVCLKQCCSADVLELIRSAASSLHPLLGMRLASAKRCRHRGADQEKAQEACCRCQQLADVVAAKKTSIELEIADRVGAINARYRTIDLKRSKLDSLNASIKAAEKAKDIRPLNFESHAQKLAQRAVLLSELIHEITVLQIDLLQLRHAQGLAP